MSPVVFLPIALASLLGSVHCAGMCGGFVAAYSGEGGGFHGMTAEEMRDVDAAVTARFPEETSAHGGQPLEPETLANGTKVFELTASVIQWEITQGEFVEAWAYNEMVPGPEIRVQLGESRSSSTTSSRSRPRSTSTA